MRLNGSIARAGFINSLIDRTSELANLGFFPGNFGWASVILSTTKASPYFIDEYNNNYFHFDKPLTALKNRFVLLTRRGYPIRSMSYSRSKTQEFLGIVRISPSGDGFQKMWGFFRQTLDIQEIYEQLFVHNEALVQNQKNEIVVYNSPNYLQHYSYYGNEKDDFQFTYDLWASFPELVKLTNKGIAIVDHLKNEHDDFLALVKPKLETYNVVVIKHQGVILTGNSWNDILGLATILDRAAQSALTVGDLKNELTSKELLKAAGKTKLNPEILAWLQAKETK